MCVYLVQCKCLGQSKAPSLFKSSSDHGCAGGGRSRGQAERVGKLYSTNLNTYVHLIYSAVEKWQLWNWVHCLSMQGLQRREGGRCFNHTTSISSVMNWREDCSWGFLRTNYRALLLAELDFSTLKMWSEDVWGRENHARFTCMYLWMCHEACLPSFTDSTVVLAKPATSPPANTQGSLVCMVSVLTSGVPQRVSFTGAKALVTWQWMDGSG